MFSFHLYDDGKEWSCQLDGLGIGWTAYHRIRRDVVLEASVILAGCVVVAIVE
jgi:hypothetical protein